ncbi:MAG TPA: glucokinase [Phenylobacterium sp.]|nr:glucokinase [Phenylobacterium sp.]
MHVGLVGDVGGTNARFALVDQDRKVRYPKTYPAKDFATLDDAVCAYMKDTAGRKRPTRAAIAVAGPVVDGEIEFTNLDWQVSEADLVANCDFEAVKLLNDFAAQALAAPRLDAESLHRVGPAERGAPDGAIAVLGPGTGFGVAALARSGGRDTPLPSEGGHGGFAPFDDVEDQILDRLRQVHGGRVSTERVLSGPGLLNLYRALGEIEGLAATAEAPSGVVDAAEGGDRLAGLAVDRFCAILGGVAGDLALTFGARGGVYIAGGIAPRLIERLEKSDFRARFEAKGRLADFVRDIPTQVITHPYTALLGAARALAELERVTL